LSLVPITVAGLTLGLDLPHEGWRGPLAPRLGKFFGGGTPDLVIRVVLDPDVAAAPGGEPRVEQDEAGLHLRHDQFHGFLPVAGEPVLTIYEPGPDPGDATWVMVVDSFLRLGLAKLLAARGGLMFHAAGIAAEGAGYVFFGPSGSGKTTVCQLSHPARRILCDEIVAVRPEGSGARLYGTPFAGAWGDSLAEDVPLRGMFWLKQAPHHRVVPLDDATAVRGLLESAVAYDLSPAGLIASLEAATALIHRVPVAQLEFRPEETLWETVLAPLPAR
jgi:hypothetical protein